MKLRFYSALILGVLAIAISLYDIYIEPNGNAIRPIAGVVVGVAVILIAFVAGLRASKGESTE